MDRPFQVTFYRLFFAAVLLMSVSSCEREGGGTSISRGELRELKEANAKAKSMVEMLEKHFEEDGYTFSPIYGTIKEDDFSSLIEGPSHVICKKVDGKSLSSEERVRVSAALKELGYQDIGLLQITQKSEQDIVPNP